MMVLGGLPAIARKIIIFIMIHDHHRHDHDHRRHNHQNNHHHNYHHHDDGIRRVGCDREAVNVRY